MRRLIAVLAALGLVLVLGASQALAADKPNDKGKGPKDNDTRSSCWRSTTSTATSSRRRPGRSRSGCCNPVLNSSGVADGLGRATGSRRRRRVPRDAHQEAARAEPEHDHRRRRRPDRRDAADLGALPRRADDRGAQRDRPRRAPASATTSSTRASTSCCACRTAAATRSTAAGGDGFAGADFQYLAANVFDEGDGRERSCPPYADPEDRQREGRFIGMTLEGDADDRHADRRRRPRLPRRGRHGRTRSCRSSQRERRARRSSSCSTRAAQNPPAPGLPARRTRLPTRTSTSASTSAAPRSTEIANGLDRRSTSSSARTRTRRTSARSTASSSRAPRRSAAGHRHRPGRSTARRRTCSRRRRRTTDRHAGRREGRATLTALVDRSTGSSSAPIANRVVGSITADIPRSATPERHERCRRALDGRRDRRRAARGDGADRLRRRRRSRS